jgi:osmotically-inducible protein OsmY
MTAATTATVDEEIQRDVLAELNWEPRVGAHEIGVTVRDGVVTLAGSVDSYAKKWAAERATHRLNRVRAVANDIEVRLPASAERTDPDIATAATRALEWDAFVPVGALDVTVADGWVVLRGDVEWEYQRRAAERSVRRLAGVRGVTNGINVRPRSDIAPDDLAERIRAALLRGAPAEAARIDVRVEAGTVRLTGTVGSWLARDEMERIAWSAPGIRVVDNQLIVRR